MPTNILVLNQNCWIVTGAGTPEGVVSAPKGSIYLSEGGGPGTTLFVKELGTGPTGWKAVGVLHHASHEPGGADVLTLTAASRLFGRGISGGGPVEEITLGPNLYMEGSMLRAKVSSANLLNYDWSTATVPPPTSSQLRLDVAHPYTTAQHLYVRPVTSDGIDVYWMLMRVHVGTGLFIQDKNDHTMFVEVKTTGPVVDAGTYVDLPVQWMSNGSALLNNQGVMLTIGAQPDTGVPAHHAAHEPGGADALVLTAGSRLFGRGASGAGPLQEITLGGGLIMNGTELQAPRSSTLVNYTYNNTLAEPPIAGQVRLNAAYPFTAATKLWMRTVSADSQDVYWGLMVIETGMTILLQDKDDHTLYVRFTATGAPIDKGLYVEIPVTHASHGGAIVTASQVLLQRSGGSSAALTALEARVRQLEQRL